MKKMYLLLLSLLVGCQSLDLETGYDERIFSISDGVEISPIEAFTSIREKDEVPVVTVHGHSLEKQKVKEKIEWFDENGHQIRTILSNWNNKFLDEKMDFSWDMVAPSKKAKAFKIYIKKITN